MGDFAYEDASSRVSAWPHAGVPRALVRDTFARVVRPLLLQDRGHELLHASAVRLPGGVVAFAAASGAGKSTVACGLAARGYPLWGDDALLFEETPSGVVTRAVPCPPRLLADVRAVLGAPPRPAVGVAAEATAPLLAVCLLAREDRRRAPWVRLARLAPADAFPRVLANAYVFDGADVARQRRMVAAYMTLAATVPVFSLGYRGGLEGLPAMLAELDRQLGEVLGPGVASGPA